MSQPDRPSVVRIAVALVALKHKPRDQSVQSYLLDLWSHFPLAGTNDDNREWRTYALELEKQLATLKTQSLVCNAPSQASDAAPPKKKSKKNLVKDPELSWDQTRDDWSRFLTSQYPSSPSLVVAYNSLQGVLASPNSDLALYALRIADVIIRALDTIHVFLFSPPNPTVDMHLQTALGEPSQLQPEHIDSTRIALTSPILKYVLRTALPALFQATHDFTKAKRLRLRPPYATTSASADAYAHVDRVVDRLLECVLLPLLRALTPLCFARLAPLLPTPPLKKDKPSRPIGKAKDKNKDKDKGAGSSASVSLAAQASDVRTDVFALIAASLEALDALLLTPPIRHYGPATGGGVESGSIASGIRDRLGLEAIRELEMLYVVPCPPAPVSSLPAPLNASQFSSQPPPTASFERPLPTPPPTLVSVSSRGQPQTRTETLSVRLERLSGTRADRVRALATKDAGWFLASVLHLCVVAPTSSSSVGGQGQGQKQGSRELLRATLLQRIGKLVWSLPLCSGVNGRMVTSEVVDGPRQSPYLGVDPGQDGDGRRQSCSGDSNDAAAVATSATVPIVIDPVCQHMLLAICERALSQLTPL